MIAETRGGSKRRRDAEKQAEEMQRCRLKRCRNAEKQ
jgi:hypothetical protein